MARADVHPRIAMAILRHSRIALTMEIYTQVHDKVTMERTPAVERLARPSATKPAGERPLRSALLYFAAVRSTQKAGPKIGTGL